MDQLGGLAALREADRTQLALDELGQEPCSLPEPARTLPELGVEQRRVPQSDRPLGPGCRVVGDDRDVLTDERAAQLGRVPDRGRGEEELGQRLPATADAAQPAEDVRDVGAEDPPVHVRLVDDHVAEVVEDVLPAAVGVVREDPDGEHVRVREDDVRFLADSSAKVVRGIAVVDPHGEAAQAKRVQRSGLILGERLRRVEVQRAGVRVAEELVENGQVERQGLSARRAGRDEDVGACPRHLERFRLVGVQRVDPTGEERPAEIGMEVLRHGHVPCGSRRLATQVRELLAGEQRVPGRGSGNHLHRRW